MGKTRGRVTAGDKPKEVPVVPPRLIGYARVSTDDQSLDLQLDALRRAGVEPHNTHTEKCSGVAKRRPGLEDAANDARAGDTLVTWKLDRVGRNLLDLLQFINTLEARGVKFRSLTEGIDTATISGRLLLQVLGALAQFERDLIVERTRAGTKARRERGGTFGPARKLTNAQHHKMIELHKSGWSLEKIGKKFGVHKMTAYLYVKTRKPVED
jgi:DNA invertase Pin-like site-specific DNA recombinase